MVNYNLLFKAERDKKLSDSAFRLFNYLIFIDGKNNGKPIEIKNGLLMEHYGCTERKIQRLTKELVELGYIKKSIIGTETNKRGNLYEICNHDKNVTLNSELEVNDKNDDKNDDKNVTLLKNNKEQIKNNKNTSYNNNSIYTNNHENKQEQTQTNVEVRSNEKFDNFNLRYNELMTQFNRYKEEWMSTHTWESDNKLTSSIGDIIQMYFNKQITESQLKRTFKFWIGYLKMRNKWNIEVIDTNDTVRTQLLKFGEWFMSGFDRIDVDLLLEEQTNAITQMVYNGECTTKQKEHFLNEINCLYLMHTLKDLPYITNQYKEIINSTLFKRPQITPNQYKKNINVFRIFAEEPSPIYGSMN